MGSFEDKLGCWSLVVIFILLPTTIMLVLSVDIIDPLQVGINYNPNGKNIDGDTLYHSGRHWVGLGHYFIKYPTTVQNLRFDSEKPGRDGETLRCWTKEGQDVDVKLNIMFQLQSEHTFRRFWRYRQDWKRVLKWVSQDAIKRTTVNFDTTQFYSDRVAVSTAMKEAVRSVLEREDVDLYDLQLFQIDLAGSFEQAVMDKVVAQQAITTMLTERNRTIIDRETDLIVANAQYNVTVLLSTADRTAKQLAAEAEANKEVAKQQAMSTAYDRLRTMLGLSFPHLAQYIWSTSLEAFDDGARLSVGFRNDVLQVEDVGGATAEGGGG